MQRTGRTAGGDYLPGEADSDLSALPFVRAGTVCKRNSMRIICSVLVVLVLAACIPQRRSGQTLPQYSASALYRDWEMGDERVQALEGRVVNVTGTISRMDLSAGRQFFIELDSRLIAFIRKDQVHTIGEKGFAVGDSVSIAGEFAGRSAVARWSTSASNSVLVVENAEVVGKSESWWPF